MSISRIASECPMCTRPLVRKSRRDGSGDFLSCTGYPRCNFAESIDLSLERLRRQLDDVTADRDNLLHIIKTGKPIE
jgi:ssDNA-binding Zn-finger/Zn-ribbon topoisomerase 1